MGCSYHWRTALSATKKREEMSCPFILRLSLFLLFACSCVSLRTMADVGGTNLLSIYCHIYKMIPTTQGITITMISRDDLLSVCLPACLPVCLWWYWLIDDDNCPSAQRTTPMLPRPSSKYNRWIRSETVRYDQQWEAEINPLRITCKPVGNIRYSYSCSPYLSLGSTTSAEEQSERKLF